MRIYALILLLLIVSCASIHDAKYDLVLDDGSIWVEQFDSTHHDDSRYNRNNKIFKEGTSFIYSFTHIDTNGEKYSFMYVDSISDWKFLPLPSNGEEIEKVSISVTEGLGQIKKGIPNYNQTVLSYSYWSKNTMAPFGSQSGVIENEKNVWMHPPRDQYFQILELNPFPYIKKPHKVGNSWEWSLSIGDFWADPRWKTWNGTITNVYAYKIVDRITLNTNLGRVKCFVVEADAISKLGKTKLVSYFSKKYGFVRLHYDNIDGSKTQLELLEIRKLN